ncbi:MAG: aminopeptidase, partial [Myxococcota bacterium]
MTCDWHHREESRVLRIFTVVACVLTASSAAIARPNPVDAFRQLEEILPTPDERRLASGRPGPRYWQQRADYRIDVELDDRRQRVKATETIRYHNNSPHALSYLWLQLDNNLFARDSAGARSASSPGFDKLGFNTMARMLLSEKFDGRIKLKKVTDGKGRNLSHTVVETMLRVDLPEALAPGETSELVIAWQYAINDGRVIRARTGYEYFEKDKNYIYEIAQWYPR